MLESLKTLQELFATFQEEAGKAADGNKAAGARARKISLEIEKRLKDFRKDSVGLAK